jgi:heme A synthase
MGFMIVETAIGAGLVVFDLVAGNTSLTRAAFGSVHLLNTFLLLASLLLCARWIDHGGAELRGLGNLVWLLSGLGVLGTLLMAVSGAVAALGDTLFPAASFIEGLTQELSSEAHLLIRLRLYHPGIAIVVGVILFLLGALLRRDAQESMIDRLTYGLSGLIAVQWVAGTINVFFLAPIWMQLLHLLLAVAIWLALLLTLIHSTLRPMALTTVRNETSS